jgi:hypothetical protein
MNQTICWALIVTLSGCASHSVRCGGPLRPINAPDASASVTHASGPTSAPSPDAAAP